jgi:hypothetical protein
MQETKCSSAFLISIYSGAMFSPANVIFTAVGVLVTVGILLDSYALLLMPSCQVARDVRASHDALVDLFDRIEDLFKRLKTYTEVPPTHAMMDVIVKIVVEVLGIFAIATKEIKQGSAGESIPLGMSQPI